MPCYKLFFQIQRYVFCQLVSVVDKIIITVILNKLISVLTDSVDIEVISDNSVKHDHFSVRVKIIISGLYWCAVGISMAFNKLFTQIKSDTLCQLISVVDEIIITVILNKLIFVLTNSVDIEVIIIHPRQKFGNTVVSAIIIQYFTYNAVINTGKEVCNACLHIALSVKEICLSVNFIRFCRIFIWRSISIISRSVPVTQTTTVSCPSTTYYATIIKRKFYRVLSILFSFQAGKSGFIKTIPFIIYHLPSANQLTVYCIIVFTTDRL